MGSRFNFRKLSLPIQRIILVLQGVQIFMIARQYLSSSANNDFEWLGTMFTGELSQQCSTSGCWLSLTPFLGSLYLTFAALCIFALFFRPGRELRLAIVTIALVHISMATTRVFLALPEFYLAGVLEQLSNKQFIAGAVTLVVALLPYHRED